MKIDHRKGLAPSRRRTKAHYDIRQSLKEGKRTFSELLKGTGLGRSTLAFHLKDMFTKGEVEKEIDPNDCRITNYKLKPKWTPEIQKEDDIETLNSMTVTSNITPKLLTDLANGLLRFHRPSIVEAALPAKQLIEFMKEHVNYSTYTKSQEEKVENEKMKELAEKAALSAMRELMFQPQQLKELSDFAIVIRFRKVGELAQKLEKQGNQQDETLHLSKKPNEHS